MAQAMRATSTPAFPAAAEHASKTCIAGRFLLRYAHAHIWAIDADESASRPRMYADADDGFSLRRGFSGAVAESTPPRHDTTAAISCAVTRDRRHAVKPLSALPRRRDVASALCLRDMPSAARARDEARTPRCRPKFPASPARFRRHGIDEYHNQLQLIVRVSLRPA